MTLTINTPFFILDHNLIGGVIKFLACHKPDSLNAQSGEEDFVKKLSILYITNMITPYSYPGGHETYNDDRSSIGHLYYILILSDLCSAA